MNHGGATKRGIERGAKMGYGEEGAL